VLRGQVVARASGDGVRGARIVVDNHDTTAADSVGRFELTLAPARYLVDVAAPGYSPSAWRIRVRDGKTLEHRFELDPTYELPDVVVEAKPGSIARRFADFERRRRSGVGYFLTQEEIERTNATSLIDVLVRVRGVQQVCLTNDCVAKMVRSPPGCYPQYFLDGNESTSYFARHTPPLDVKGIEIYRGSSETPGEFLGTNSACGVIAIWTKSAP
jgi:Carboxypeptidase regulatory-like domain